MTVNKINKNYKRSQRGRSMVEMLGILAIIGVLSVGGVYGYGVAMKKHKANELLHQASMLASSIAAQIASGKTDLALENFSNSSYGTFSGITQPNDEQFTLQITDMDSAVCEQMEKIAGGMVRKVECGTVDANGKTTATLKFNNNLSSESVAGDNDGNQEKCEESGNKYCSGSGSCVAQDKECGCGGDIFVCKVCNMETGGYDNLEDGTPCKTSDDQAEYDGLCQDGTCVNAPACPSAGTECSVYENNCCGSAPYCQFQNDAATEMGVCATTGEFAFCSSDADCTDPNYPVCGTPDPYSFESHGKPSVCIPTNEGRRCDLSNDDCRSEAPYCNFVTFGCVKSGENMPCMCDSCHDSCTDPNFPYCMPSSESDTRYYCSAYGLGAWCETDMDCPDPNFPHCINGKCEMPGFGYNCTTNAECTNPDYPYCVYETFGGLVQEGCNDIPLGMVCETSEECGEHYCAPSPTNWETTVCCLTGDGQYCIEDSDCEDPNYPYCWGETCVDEIPEENM